MSFTVTNEIRIDIEDSAWVFMAALAVLSVLALGWPTGILAAAAITLSVLLHEFGHVAVATYYGVKVKRVGLSLKGAYTVRSRSDRTHVEALTTLAGPAMNFLLFGTFVLIFSGKTSLYIAELNLVLAVSNLLPIGPSDGLRLLRLLSTPRAQAQPKGC